MSLVVSLHDVHPTSLAAVARQRAELRLAGISRFSLLVVPRWHGHEKIEQHAKFVETLEDWRAEGDEIVLHGLRHDCVGLKETWRNLFWTRAYTNREAEFIGVGAIEAHDRLVAGRAIFEQCGWHPGGFVAPAWLMSRVVPQVLQLSGFAYTATRTALIPLASGVGPAVSPSLCYSTRTNWRRQASLLWNQRLFGQLEKNPLLRISVHPGDLEHPAIWRQLLGFAAEGISQGRRPTTYADVVTDLESAAQSEKSEAAAINGPAAGGQARLVKA